MKKRTARDRINHSHRQLLEYSHSDPDKRLDTYLTSLAPAIARIHSVLSSIPAEIYDKDKMNILTQDYLYTDIQIIPYWLPNNKISYISFQNAKLLEYPKDNYEIIDTLTGKCKKFGNVEFFCTRLAVDYSLEATSHRWLKEIPNILEFVSKYSPVTNDSNDYKSCNTDAPYYRYYDD